MVGQQKEVILFLESPCQTGTRTMCGTACYGYLVRCQCYEQLPMLFFAGLDLDHYQLKGKLAFGCVERISETTAEYHKQ
jgi:hypothetical protein